MPRPSQLSVWIQKLQNTNKRPGVMSCLKFYLSHAPLLACLFSWLDSPSGSTPPRFRGFVITGLDYTGLLYILDASEFPSSLQTRWRLNPRECS
jgi:hypothetical protein